MVPQDAIEPYTTLNDIKVALKGEQVSVKEGRVTLLWMSKRKEEGGRHWRCQVTLVAAAAESCRSGRQVVEKAPGRPLLFWHIRLLFQSHCMN